MKSLTSEMADLSRLTRHHLQELQPGTNAFFGTPETHAYFMTPIHSREAPPIPKYTPTPSSPAEQGQNSPTKITPKPTFPAIQRPLPPPARKPLPIPPQIIETPKKNAASPTSEFQLETLDLPKNGDFSDLKSIYQKRFPQQTIIEELPDDSLARLVPSGTTAISSYPQVALLSFSGNPKLLEFMRNLARAIELRWGFKTEVLPAHQWEQEKAWEALLSNKGTKLILASDYGLQTVPVLMKHYREISRQGQHYLGNIPLLLLSDLTLYLREPHLKLSLWQAICAQLR